ncbi:MAG: type II toxin-antitoxin system ParD family antitoxin [Myxococcales bacterium]|nr:type II toxin-antitoxin system ParD family antitoxin [Myxococcales bacterium]
MVRRLDAKHGARRIAKNPPFVFGGHFDAFVRAQVEAGRYANATDMSRSGRRMLEEREATVRAPRDALSRGSSLPARCCLFNL